MLPGVQKGTWGSEMRPWIKAFYRRVWETVQAAGVDYLVEDMNEGDALGWDDNFMVDWLTWSNAALWRPWPKPNSSLLMNRKNQGKGPDWEIWLPV